MLFFHQQLAHELRHKEMVNLCTWSLWARNTHCCYINLIARCPGCPCVHKVMEPHNVQLPVASLIPICPCCFQLHESWGLGTRLTIYVLSHIYVLI